MPSILSPEKIRELAQSATKGPWYNGRLGLIVTKGGKTVVSANIMSDVDSAFIAALPDIAATAIHYADRVKELEKEMQFVKDKAWHDGYTEGYDVASGKKSV